MHVVNNLSPQPQTVTLDGVGDAGRPLADLLSGEPVTWSTQPGHLQIEGYGYRWLKWA